MNINGSGTLYKQARKQAVWAGVWLFVAVVAVVIRKDTPDSQQWLVDQLIILAGLLMFFQFGRMFQGLAALRMNVSASVPHALGAHSAATVPAQVAAPATVEPAVVSKVNMDMEKLVSGREIRSFASIEEAKDYGWSFGETVAHLGDVAVPSVAIWEGVSYKYDGLAPEKTLGSVPMNKRVFGRLLYMQVENAPFAPPASGLTIA